MKALAALIITATFTTAACAETKYVRATVVGVEPMFKSVEVTDCYPVQVPVYRNNTADVAAGAIIGGVIGNQFGKGDGKTAMTVLGAILGANTAQNNSNRVVGAQITNQCVTRYDQQVSGYLITYQWKTLTSQMISEYPYELGDHFDAAVTFN